MRVWIVLICAIGTMAGAVLYASEAQRTTADVNLREVQAAAALRDAMLAQERLADDYLVTHQPGVLADYVAAGRRLTSGLDAAGRVSADDELETAAIAEQARDASRWRALAQQDISAAQRVPAPPVGARETPEGRALIARFLAANDRYSARLATLRDEEMGAAALVPVWLIVGLSVVFGALGGYVVRRTKRTRVSEEAAKAAAAAQDREFASGQARFA